jgi:uncharacterized protein with HEPN domain
MEAADAIYRFVEDVERADFFKDEMRQSAVLQKLIIIGEAAARLSTDFWEQYPKVEWADIVGFRNIAVHEYFAISWPVVWVTATQDVSRLRRKIAQILAKESSEASD